jgi:hypothetical protein
MIPRRGVVVPFADALAELLPDDGVEARRSFPHLLALVSASALLHYRQRASDAAGNVVADLRDYQVALAVGGDALGIAHGGVTPGTRRFFDRLRGKYPELEFDSNEAQAVGGGSRSTVRSRLAELNEAGLIEQTAAPRGKVAARWKLTGEQAAVRTGGLPLVVEVAEWLATNGGLAADPTAPGASERPRASEDRPGRANPGSDTDLPVASERPELAGNDVALIDLSFLEADTGPTEGAPPLSGRRRILPPLHPGRAGGRPTPERASDGLADSPDTSVPTAGRRRDHREGRPPARPPQGRRKGRDLPAVEGPRQIPETLP